MTADDNGGLRTIAWSELFPWLNLFRVFRFAVGGRVLVLATAGLLLSTAGWWLLSWVFHPGVLLSSANCACPWTCLAKAVPNAPFFGTPGARTELLSAAESQNPVLKNWVTLSEPLWRGLAAGVPLRDLAYFIVCGLWGVAVWGFFGGAITRMAAVHLACEENLSLSAALRHTAKKWLAYVTAPLFPLLGVGLLVLPLALLGLLLRLQIGILLLGVVWPLLLIDGLIITLLVLGVGFGWPLMWATISTESTDSFDALSRSYAYVFQRPLHYLFYTLVAAVLGGLGWILVSQLAAFVVYMTYWGCGWGAGHLQILAIQSASADLGSLGYGGAALIAFWVGCVKMLALGYLFSFFWTASSAIYLLLRRNVDATEMDEVVLDEEDQAYGLPPLKTDTLGAPVLDESQNAPNDKIAKGQDEE
jgi:hypothetical protein